MEGTLRTGVRFDRIGGGDPITVTYSRRIEANPEALAAAIENTLANPPVDAVAGTGVVFTY